MCVSFAPLSVTSERKSIKFADHLESEHNPWNYMYYKIYLESKNRASLTAREKYLRRKIDSQSIEYFPINQALCLTDSGGEDDMAESIEAIDKKVDSLTDSLAELSATMVQLSSAVAALTVERSAVTSSTVKTTGEK